MTRSLIVLLLAAAAASFGVCMERWRVDGGYENREPTAEALGRVAWAGGNAEWECRNAGQF